MKKTSIIVSVIASLIFIGCGVNKTENTHQHDASHNHEEHAQENVSAGHQHNQAYEIELVDGKKWMVNNEMKPFLQKGEELVNQYLQNNQTDYKTLATQLNEQNSQLIKSCTMEGKSHDELHKWLHPHLELVKELEKVSIKEDADHIIHHISESYQAYKNYFE